MEQHLQGARIPTFTGRSRGMLHLRNGLKMFEMEVGHVPVMIWGRKATRCGSSCLRIEPRIARSLSYKAFPRAAHCRLETPAIPTGIFQSHHLDCQDLQIPKGETKGTPMHHSKMDHPTIPAPPSCNRVSPSSSSSSRLAASAAPAAAVAEASSTGFKVSKATRALWRSASS